MAEDERNLRKYLEIFKKQLGVSITIPTEHGGIKRYRLVGELAKHFTTREIKRKYGNPSNYPVNEKLNDETVKIFDKNYGNVNKMHDKQLCMVFCKTFGKDRSLEDKLD